MLPAFSLAFDLATQDPQPNKPEAPQTVLVREVDDVCTRWSVLNNKLLAEREVPLKFPSDPDAAAAKLTEAYVAAGYLTVRVLPVKEKCELQVIEFAAKPVGKYADMLPEGRVLTQATLERQSALISRAAADNQEKVKIRVGAPDMATRTIPIHVDALPDEKAQATRSGATLNNSGSRYSGAYVGGFWLQHADQGYRLDANVSKALDAGKGDSEGGDYKAFSGKLSTAHRWGIFSVEASRTQYQLGGPTQVLQMQGTSDRYAVGYEKPLSLSTTFVSQLGLAKSRTDIGLLKWTEDASYTYGYTGLRYQSTLFGKVKLSGNLGVTKGSGQQKTYNVAPLTAAQPKGFTKTTGELQAIVPLASVAALTLRTGFQASKDVLPTSETFFLGGDGRGASYASGAVFGSSGAYAGARLTLLNLPEVSGTKVMPFVGINGGRLTDNQDVVRQTKSSEVGATVTSGRLNGTVSFAKHLGKADVATDKDYRINLSVGYEF